MNHAIGVLPHSTDFSHGLGSDRVQLRDHPSRKEPDSFPIQLSRDLTRSLLLLGSDSLSAAVVPTPPSIETAGARLRKVGMVTV